MDPLTIGLGISGAVFLAGLIIIVIWKILILIYDRAEYSKFEAEIKDPVWEKVNTFHHKGLNVYRNWQFEEKEQLDRIGLLLNY